MLGEGKFEIDVWKQIWNMTIRNGSFVLEHLKSMHHLDHVGYNIGAAMTCVLPLAQRVYTGDEDGRVVCAMIPHPIYSDLKGYG